MCRYIFILGILLSLTGCAGFEQRYRSSYDFEMIQTVSFNYRYCGVEGSPSNEEKNSLITFIRDDIEKELKAQGFIPVRIHADVRIRFGLILKGNGKNIDPARIGSVKEEEPLYASTFDYKPGSLIIDAVDPFTEEIVWRRAIDTNIETNTPLDQKQKRLSPFIKKLLKDFPVKEQSISKK